MTVEYIDSCIKNALEGKSNIDEYILNIRGFSTPTIRRLFNNICQPAEKYLEVGLYCGATFVSSFNKNLTSIGVEDYSQNFSVDSVKEELEMNIKSYDGRAKSVQLYLQDCFKINTKDFPKDIDIYFYDGHHAEHFQAQALPYFIDNMAKKFIFIVDDYGWESVRKGTESSFKQLADKIKIVNKWELFGGSHSDDPIWHNGMLISLISKI